MILSKITLASQNWSHPSSRDGIMLVEQTINQKLVKIYNLNWKRNKILLILNFVPQWTCGNWVKRTTSNDQQLNWDSQVSTAISEPRINYEKWGYMCGRRRPWASEMEASYIQLIWNVHYFREFIHHHQPTIKSSGYRSALFIHGTQFYVI